MAIGRLSCIILDYYFHCRDFGHIDEYCMMGSHPVPLPHTALDVPTANPTSRPTAQSAKDRVKEKEVVVEPYQRKQYSGSISRIQIQSSYVPVSSLVLANHMVVVSIHTQFQLIVHSMAPLAIIAPLVISTVVSQINLGLSIVSTAITSPLVFTQTGGLVCISYFDPIVDYMI